MRIGTRPDDVEGPHVNTCSRCLADLFISSAHYVNARNRSSGEIVSLRYTADLQEIEDWAESHLADEWTVSLDNASGALHKVTTWHGDPVCRVHLYELRRQELDPQTVRMAQWGRR